MATVKIYRFAQYDAHADQKRVSRRWGTLEGIAAIKCIPLMETGTEVDEDVVRSEEPGLTVVDFDPRPRRTGFQTSMRVD